jgi:membrane protein
MEATNLSTTIANTINELIQDLFSSIDNNIYSYIDEIIFLTPSSISNNNFEDLFTTSSKSILVIANALILAYLLYYCVKLFLSYYSGTQVERPYQFIFKLILCAIIMNSSYFICEQLINITDLITQALQEIGSNFTSKTISFKTLVTELNSVISISGTSLDIFSLTGIIKSFCSIGLISLMFSYAIRLIMVKVFIILAPFAILSCSINSFSWFFRSWFRSFFSLLFMQFFITIILIVTLSLDFSSNLISKFLYVGSIYALTKSNTYIRSLIGGISTEINTNLSTLKSFLRAR